MNQASPSPNGIESRRAVMAVLALAETRAIEAGIQELGRAPDFVELRRPETGLVMLRGRMGGVGAPFNLGEATVTRAAVQLSSGESGFSYILGRDHSKARAAALVDALWQNADLRPLVETRIVAPLRAAQAERDALGARRTAATKVDFFTLVRGED